MPARGNATPHLIQENSIMDFEDNWAYPWPTSMFDPVLKIILRPSHGREPEKGGCLFRSLL
jgi:hypothetical protein